MQIWKEVRDVIKENMVQRFRAETGPLQNLASALQRLRREALSSRFDECDLDDYKDVIASWDEHLRSLAADGHAPADSAILQVLGGV